MTVSLRKITEADTANIVKWRNRADVKSWLFSQSLVTEESHMNWYRTRILPGFCSQYIIEWNDGMRLQDIDTTFIKRQELTSDVGEFGIFIGEPSAKGKHCSLPATKEMLRIGFNELNLQLIFLEVFSENIPAIKTYEHAGFKVISAYDYDKIRKVLKMEINRLDFLNGGGILLFYCRLSAIKN